MPNSSTCTYHPIGLKRLLGGFILLMLFPLVTLAQEADTTRKELKLKQEQKQRRQMLLQGQLERSVSGGIMTGMGTYRVPDETQYYTPPFKGQYYLDTAVEAYRKQLEKNIGPHWLGKFIRAVSPFINNRFEFGVYQIYDLPVVERSNPLFKSYKNPNKRQ